MLPNEKTLQQAKTASNAPTERCDVKLFAKYPAHNNYFCSYEVVIESEIFKPETGRSAMIYFTADNALEKSHYSNGRFFFYLPKSIQPLFETAIDLKSLLVSVHIVMDANRPNKDQSDAVFRLQNRDIAKTI